MLVSLVVLGHLDVSEAGTVLTTIRAGSTVSVDDITFGTTLIVQDMLADASGPEGAVFNATRLQFSGILNIRCPTSASQWSKPLTVLIKDGYSLVVRSAAPYMDFTGVLAYNSSITIIGGSFPYAVGFMTAMSGLNIQAGSTLVFTGGLFNISLLAPTNLDFIKIGGGLSVTNRSAITISDNVFSVTNQVSSNLQLRTLYVFGSFNKTITDRSSLAITNNRFYAVNITLTDGWSWYFVYFAQGEFLVSNSSSFKVRGNTFVSQNITVAASWTIFTLVVVSDAPVNVTHSSTLSVSNNSAAVFNATLMGAFSHLSSLMSVGAVTESSSVLFNHNTLHTAHLICSSSWKVNTLSLSSSSMYIDNSCVLEVSHNHVTMSKGPYVPGVGGAVDRMAGSILGSFDVIGNSFVAFNVTGTLTTVDVKNSAPAAFTLLGWLTIAHNVLNASTPLTCATLFFVSSISSGPTGSISLAYNVIEGGSAASSAIRSIASILVTPSVYVCNNTISRALCTLNGSAYSCAAPTVQFGSLSGCDPTDTMTHTPSAPTPVMSPTHTLFSPTPTPLVSPTPTAPSTLSIHYTSNTATNIATSSLQESVTESAQSSVTSSVEISRTLSTPTPTDTLRLSLMYTTSPTPSLPPSPTCTQSPTPILPQPPSLPLPHCNSTCADVVSMQLVLTGVTAAQAIAAYWSSHDNTTAAVRGCSPIHIPFDATFKGASALLLVRVGVGVNTTYPTGNATFPTTSADGDGIGDIVAVGASRTVSEGGVVVVSIRRLGASPLSTLTGSISLPGGVLLCTPTATSGGPWANIELGAPPTALGENERIVIAAVSMASADLQTVAAIGLLRCTPGSNDDVESEAGVRALVPIALSGTCAGAVQGALVGVCVALVVSVGATCTLRAVRGVGWAEAAATTRCPSLMLSVWGFLQMGFVVCGARLMTAEGGGGEAVLGGVGVVVGGVLPGVYVLLAWSVVSRRCYRLAQLPGALAGQHCVVVWARGMWLPSYELDSAVYPVSQAYSVVVGRTWRVSPWWAGLSVIQPVVMVLVVFVQGTSCNVMLIVAGVVLALVGCVHALFRPHRIVAANYLQAFAMLLNACVLFVASALVGDPLNIPALDSNRAISMLQVGMSVCRMSLSVGTFVYMRLYRKTIFTRANGDGSVPGEEESDVLPTPVFDVRGYLYDRCGGGVLATHKACYESPPQLANPPILDSALLIPLPATSESPPLTVPHAEVPPYNPPPNNPQPTPDKKRPPPNTRKPISGLSPTGLFSLKTNTQFADSIISTVMNNHRGYIPMERPYTMLWEGDPLDDADDDVEEELALVPKDVVGTPPSASRRGSTRSVSDPQDSSHEEASYDLLSLSGSDNSVEL